MLSFLLRAALAVAFVGIGLEILGHGGMPPPRRIALLLAVTSLVTLVLPDAIRARRRRDGSPIDRRPSWPQRLGLSITGLAGAFVLLETVAVGLFPDLPLEIAPDLGSPTPLVQRDPQLRGRLTPGFHGRFLRWSYRGIPVRINEHGFRDRPWQRRAAGPHSELRVLVIGDSFTFGTGVPEEATYVREAERQLGDAGSVRFFDAAVPGFGPIDEMFLLRRHFDDVTPDFVIVALYTGNDLDDVRLAIDRLSKQSSEPPLRAGGASGRSIPVHALAIGRRLLRPPYWMKHCRICGLAEPGISMLATRLGARVGDGDRDGSLLLRACARVLDPDVAETLHVLVDALDDGAEFCRWRRAQLGVLLLPLREFVTPGAFERALAETPGGRSGDFSPDVLHERIGRALTERGIPHLDLLPQLRARAANGARLFLADGHLNLEGHRAVAGALVPFLQSLGAGR